MAPRAEGARRSAGAPRRPLDEGSNLAHPRARDDGPPRVPRRHRGAAGRGTAPGPRARRRAGAPRSEAAVRARPAPLGETVRRALGGDGRRRAKAILRFLQARCLERRRAHTRRGDGARGRKRLLPHAPPRRWDADHEGVPYSDRPSPLRPVGGGDRGGGDGGSHSAPPIDDGPHGRRPAPGGTRDCRRDQPRHAHVGRRDHTHPSHVRARRHPPHPSTKNRTRRAPSTPSSSIPAQPVTVRHPPGAPGLSPRTVKVHRPGRCATSALRPTPPRRAPSAVTSRPSPHTATPEPSARRRPASEASSICPASRGAARPGSRRCIGTARPRPSPERPARTG